MPSVMNNRSHQVFACTLFTAVLCFYVTAAIAFPMAYIWATYEDLFGEWVQFWSFIAALVLSVRLSWSRWRLRWFFILLACSCFYVAMEEISWGQRLLGFSSPEFFRAKNLQSETNLHNFFTGPYKTTLKVVITYVLAAALATYGLVYPAFLRLRWRFAVWLDARGLAAPPLYLWPFFVAAAILECGLFHFNEAEVAEVLVGLGLALMTVQYDFTRRRQLDAHRSASWPGHTSRQLALRLGAVTTVVLALAVGTTMAVYASESRKAKIDARIENGIEKFADRYARYEQWGIVAELYQHLLAKKPRSTFLLRTLAITYREMGDDKRFDEYANKALDIGLERYQKDPQSASANRSLVRTYSLVGMKSKVDQHLQEALRIGLERVKKHPTSASAAYSLGKTYSLMGRDHEALEQFSKAHDLKPESK